jgi:hypothetical protein
MTDTQNDHPVADALRLAHYGTPSFPCREDKRPACPHGFKDATADPEKLRELWRQCPGPLVGVPTGEASGIFVVDVDSARHEEANDWLERHSPCLPDTKQHATKSGGLHLLFKHRAGLRNSESRLAKGVDTRGEGGYIIWWPFHVGLNAPHKLDLPIADLPDEIYQRLVEKPRVMRFTGPVFGKSVGEPSRKLQGVLDAVAAGNEGNRNSLLFWGACRISDMIANREIGSMEGARAFEALNLVSTAAGLPAREVARTIRSAAR